MTKADIIEAIKAMSVMELNELVKECEEEFGVGMRQEDTLLRDKLNSVLKQMSEDGTTAKISQKWFGEDISMKL